MHAAVGHRALVDVGDRLVDDLARHWNAGVATAPQALYLRDRGRALVEVVAILRAHVPPAAVDRLGAAGKLDRLGEHLYKLIPPAFFYHPEEPQKLLDNIKRLLQSPQYRKNIGNQLYRRVDKEFGLEVAAKRMGKVITGG